MTDLPHDLIQAGYALVPAEAMRLNLLPFGSPNDWDIFAASWNDLPQDTHMADGGRYRRRRHAVFSANANDDRIVQAPHRAHYQEVNFNPLNGGSLRNFAPIERRVVDTETVRTVLAFSRALFDSVSSPKNWDIEMHQFRIESKIGAPGLPTPEGLHRDGVDYALVLLIARVNIECGVTTIHALNRSLLGSFTLAAPFDAAIVCDQRVYHGVTAVQPIAPTLTAYRDVLVLTFRAI